MLSRTRDEDGLKYHISTTQGTNIGRVTEYKYLSIWIDEQLTFKHHIDNLVTKLR